MNGFIKRQARQSLMDGTSLPSYVLVTPARNEASFIEKTLQSMVAQTVKPARWVIVSDGSTDGTDDIVSRYAASHNWIDLISISDRATRNFASKVKAFDAGYAVARRLAHDVVGNVDADTSFGPDHFEFLLRKFAEEPRLGVSGTAFVEGDSLAYNYTYTNIEHVSGQCQLFRRECFEEIGGYREIRGGGIDWTAVTTARMMGWRTRTFTERFFVHHRPMGTGTSGALAARFRFGRQDYYLGSDPAWELLRAVYQMRKRPYVVGGLVLYSGYLWASLRRLERPIPPELVAFRREEQKRGLRRILRHVLQG
jgi:poly-beta-1,6-N-acetyl-D-glucosamine synthase